MSGDPFTDVLEQFRDEVLDGVGDLLEPHLARSGAAETSELDPFKLYTAQEAATILGLDRTTIYDIPEADLPRCRVGPARGSTRWMGADLLAYAQGLDPIDYESLLKDLRETLQQPHSSVPNREDGPTRVR